VASERAAARDRYREGGGGRSSLANCPFRCRKLKPADHVSYVGNLGFDLHCHPLDSINPGFIWRAPLVNPLDSFGLTYTDS